MPLRRLARIQRVCPVCAFERVGYAVAIRAVSVDVAEMPVERLLNSHKIGRKQILSGGFYYGRHRNVLRTTRMRL